MNRTMAILAAAILVASVPLAAHQSACHIACHQQALQHGWTQAQLERCNEECHGGGNPDDDDDNPCNPSCGALAEEEEPAAPPIVFAGESLDDDEVPPCAPQYGWCWDGEEFVRCWHPCVA